MTNQYPLAGCFQPSWFVPLGC